MTASSPSTRTRDIVVIGASAGGVIALPALAADLPADLPAAVLVVQHLAITSPRLLVDIIQRASRLPVRWAADGEPLQNSEIVVAQPGMHLLVDGTKIVLSDGPRENHAKPSINRLFRSAAAHHSNRTIGVLLTGTLDDGVSGLEAIKWCGGTTIVQDPEDAEYPDLPRNAINAIGIDRVVPLSRIGASISQLAGSEVADHIVPQELQLHAQLDRLVRTDPHTMDTLGTRDAAMCPDCGGPLWRVGGAGHDVFRCYLGHALSGMSLVRDQAAASEEAMWNVVRTLEESAFTLGSRAHGARQRGDVAAATFFDGQVAQLQEQAGRQRELIRDVLTTYATK